MKKKNKQLMVERTHIVSEDIRVLAVFNRVGDVTEDGTNPQKHRETTKELLAKFDPFRRRFGRSKAIGPIAFQVGLGLLRRQTLIVNSKIGILIIWLLVFVF